MKSRLRLKLGIGVIVLFGLLILGFYLFTPLQYHYWRGKLDSEKESEREEAIEKLVEIEPKCRDRLVKEASTPESPHAAEAAIVLGKAGKLDPESLDFEKFVALLSQLAKNEVKEPIPEESLEKCKNRYFKYRPEGRNENYYKLLYSLRKPMRIENDNSNSASKRHSHVLAALAFFREFQAPDGRWFSEDGTLEGDLLVTGLVLLAMFDYGQTHRIGTCKHTIRKTLDFFKSEMEQDGHFSDDTLVQAVCTMVMCNLYAVTKDEAYKPYAEKSLEHLFSRQLENDGLPRQKGETEADIRSTSYSMFALHWANFGKLDNLETKRQKLLKYFENNVDKIKEPEHAAMAYVSYVYLGGKNPSDNRKNPQLIALAKILEATLPSKDGNRDADYIRWGTKAMFLLRGKPWQRWNKAMKETVIPSHITIGSLRGSWNPDTDILSQKYGRIYATAMHAFILEVYYIIAHIPKWESDK